MPRCSSRLLFKFQNTKVDLPRRRGPPAIQDECEIGTIAEQVVDGFLSGIGPSAIQEEASLVGGVEKYESGP